MFRIVNAFNDAEVEVTLGEKKITFNIESIINRRLRDKIEPEKVFIILNAYVDSREVEFREALFQQLMKSKNILLMQMTKPDIDPLPLELVHGVLDLFDFDDVIRFIKESKIILPPSDLPDKFNEKIIFDEKGSREQTYIKDDYIELIGLITILKATVGPLGEFATIKDTILSKSDYKGTILFSFYASHPIYNTPPFIKLIDSIRKLVDRLFNDEENTAIRLIENTINRDSLPESIMASIVIQKLLINAELSDTNTKNTITKIYSFASNRLKLKDTTSDIRIKRFNSGGEDLESETSIMESYRSPTSITIGFMTEFEIVFEDPIRLARWLGVKAPDEDIYKLLSALEILKHELPVKESIYITSWILKEIIDPRAFDYLEIDHIVVGIAVSIIYLWENGFKDIAMILGSYSHSINEHKLNFSLKSKLDQEIKDKLLEIFPNNKKVGVNGEFKESSFIEEIITNISKELMGYNLVSALPDGYIMDYRGDILKEVIVKEDIKNRLAELTIMINE